MKAKRHKIRWGRNRRRNSEFLARQGFSASWGLPPRNESVAGLDPAKKSKCNAVLIDTVKRTTMGAALEINCEAGTEDVGPTAAARRGGLAVVDGKIPLNFGVGI